MSRLFWLFLGLVIGGGAIYGAFNFHVLKTDSGFQLVPKRSASLSDTYVDIRKFGVAEWAAHPALSADIIAAEKSQLMNASPANSFPGDVRDLLNEIRR